MGRIADIINLRNPLNISNPFQQNGTSAGLIPGTVQYQQENPQKTTLQQAYEQAMSKTTPSWVNALSNAMPAIAQIGALGATKGAFNQGYVSDSLEREKQRQLAYNQAKQQQEQQRVKDFVAMAEKQLGIDRANEDRDYTRAYQEAIDKQNQANRQQEWDNKLALQAEAKAQQAFVNDVTTQKLDMERQKLNAEIKASNNNSQTIKNLIDSINLQNKQNEQKILEKENEQMLKNAKDDLNKGKISQAEYDLVVANPQFYKEILKQNREKTKANMQLAENLNAKGAIDSATFSAINNDSNLANYLVPKSNASGGIRVFGTTIRNATPNTFELDYAQIIRDKTGKEPTKKDIARLKKDLGLKDD